MVKISSIFGLGVLVALVQFLGFPLGWKNALYLLSGITIVVLSVLIRRELLEVVKKMHTDDVVETETFAESMPKSSQQAE